MDKILGALAVIVLIITALFFQDHAACGVLIALALGGSALLLRRCESSLGCMTFAELSNKALEMFN